MVPLLRRVAQMIVAAFAVLSAVVTFYQDKWPKVALASAIVLILLLVWELIERQLQDKPRLLIKHEPYGKTYWMEGARLHRIGVENTGGKQAEDVQVWLRGIDPDPSLTIDVIPSKFGHKGGNCSSGGDVCVISPHDEHHFDVIQCVDRFGDADAVWGLVTVEYMNQPVHFENHRQYHFSLRARANDTQNEDRVLSVQNNGDGSLSIKLLERQAARKAGFSALKSLRLLRLRLCTGRRAQNNGSAARGPLSGP